VADTYNNASFIIHCYRVLIICDPPWLALPGYFWQLGFGQ